MMPFKYENRKAKPRTTVHVAHSLRSIFQKFFGKVPPPFIEQLSKVPFQKHAQAQHTVPAGLFVLAKSAGTSVGRERSGAA